MGEHVFGDDRIMLVSHFCDTNSIGGTEIAIHRYAEAVGKFGVENRIFMGGIKPTLAFFRTYKTSIIHNHMCISIFPHFYIISKFKKIPSVITLHSMFNVETLFPPRFTKEFEKYIYLLNGIFNCITVPSHTVKNYWQERGLKEINVVPYPIDTSIFRPRKVKKSKRFSLIYVGQFRRDKRVPLLLRAVKDLDVDVNLIGGLGADCKYVKAYAKNHSNIKISGFIPNHKLPRIYSQCHVYVNASISETFGLSMAEAMACGLPVISMRNLGAEELIKKKTGFIVKNEKEMREKIIYLKENADLRRKMGKEALERIKPFSPHIVGKKLFNLYKSIC